MLFTHEDTRPLLHFCNVQNAAEIRFGGNQGMVTLIVVVAAAARGIFGVASLLAVSV